jgi:xanthine dehydrogenase YagT iron-sulfur-binding subunit
MPETIITNHLDIIRYFLKLIYRKYDFFYIDTFIICQICTHVIFTSVFTPFFHPGGSSMRQDSKPKKISRRKFLRNLGTGVVSSTVALHGLHAAVQEKGSLLAPPLHKEKTALTLSVNGKKITTLVDPETSLAQLLRNQLKLTGTKIVCDHGECGACTVLLDGKAVYSCQMLALDAADHQVVTIEGLLKAEELHPIQQAFLDHDGYQCGFCTPGQIMAAHALLLKNPKPSREEILTGMSGNLCRCAAYPKILDSVIGASEK